MGIGGRMTKFRIDELSGVDRPAQKGARKTIMKRDCTRLFAASSGCFAQYRIMTATMMNEPGTIKMAAQRKSEFNAWSIEF